MDVLRFSELYFDFPYESETSKGDLFIGSVRLLPVFSEVPFDEIIFQCSLVNIEIVVRLCLSVSNEIGLSNRSLAPEEKVEVAFRF